MKTIITIYTLMLFSGCKKFVEVPPPPTRLESVKVFSTKQTALSALNGLYSIIRGGNLNILNGGITLYSGLSGDELFHTAPNEDAAPFYQNSILPDHTNLYNRLWRAAYNNNLLYSANAFIENLNASDAIRQEDKSLMIGEAKVIRCIGYFYLINLFGDVPLITSTSMEENINMPRIPVSTIYSFLEDELTEAKQLLKNEYAFENRTRINRLTASSLLARVYLFQNKWKEAERESSEVINSSVYSLESDVNNVFSVNSKETIWQLSKDGANTSEGSTFVPSNASARPNYAITNDLVQSFEVNDQRKQKWIGKNIVAGTEFYFPFKYKSRLASHTTEFYIVFRLAEQYLIRSEARLELNNWEGALLDLNKVRQRAGLEEHINVDPIEIKNKIFDERRHELFIEFGHRWFDLKRVGKADFVFAGIKAPYWESSDQLYPIPLIELERNPHLIQNPGY